MCAVNWMLMYTNKYIHNSLISQNTVLVWKSLPFDIFQIHSDLCTSCTKHHLQLSKKVSEKWCVCLPKMFLIIPNEDGNSTSSTEPSSQVPCHFTESQVVKRVSQGVLITDGMLRDDTARIHLPQIAKVWPGLWLLSSVWKQRLTLPKPLIPFPMVFKILHLRRVRDFWFLKRPQEKYLPFTWLCIFSLKQCNNISIRLLLSAELRIVPRHLLCPGLLPPLLLAAGYGKAALFI